jgi:hypothetical protein
MSTPTPTPISTPTPTPTPTPDQTVKVTYDGVNSSSWSFDPKTVQMTQAGKIILHRDSQSPDWVFNSVNGIPSGWQQTTQGNGSQITINDTLNPPVENYTYTVTVTYNGVPSTSPSQTPMADSGVPPVIMNDGTVPGTRPKPKA